MMSTREEMDALKAAKLAVARRKQQELLAQNRARAMEVLRRMTSSLHPEVETVATGRDYYGN